MYPEEKTKVKYEQLQVYLDELYERGKIEFYELDENHSPIYPKELKDRVAIYTLAPKVSERRKRRREDAKKMGEYPSAKLDSNELSLVLVLNILSDKSNFNALFTGDASSEICESGLRFWDDKAKEISCDSRFDVVKVSHHGSIHSHSKVLVSSGKESVQRVAAISCGTRTALPDRQVIRNYLENGWIVLTTTRRKIEEVHNRPFELVNRRKTETELLIETHDIIIEWTEEDNLGWRPAEAEIHIKDLENYETNIEKI